MRQITLHIIGQSFAGKVDKAGEPYIHHLLRVAAKFDTHPDRDNLQIIALLHDLQEDCPEWNEERLRAIFPSIMVDGVLAMTKRPGQTYDQFIDQVLTNSAATLVKKADLEDNMDITRLKVFTNKDCERWEKYHKAYLRILAKIQYE